MNSTSSTPVIATPSNSTPNSRPGTPNLLTPPTSATSDRPQDDSSKLKAFWNILRKLIGVPDIAQARFSMPTTLIEPIPNLEYWHYLDRPETFASIGRSDNDVGRMLEVLRFWFTKDLKYVKGKPCKPYNSTLGEFFRCNWEINDDAPPIDTPSKAPAQPPPDPLAVGKNPNPIRISYLTEQTSHHPPVSAYYIDCPERGIHGQGYDQISVKFAPASGTLRITPGNFNKGIFITLTKRDNEEYQLTHPAASLGGILRGGLSITVADSCFITCPKTRLKVILTYAEESLWGKVQNRVHGVVFRYDPDDDKYIRTKDVPEKDVLVKLEGCWHEQIFYTIPSNSATKKDSSADPTKDKQLLVDLTPMMPVPKIVPPPEEQLSNESRKFWDEVSRAINEKRFNDATRIKQDLEQRQRDKAAERKTKEVEWEPRFFTSVTEPDGQPHLSEEGRRVLDGLSRLDFHLKEAEVTGA